MNHIVLGTDNSDSNGLYIGLAGIVAVALANWLANWMAWKHPRADPARR